MHALTRGQMTAKDKPTMDKQIANTISPLFILESLKFFETPKILNSNVLRKAKL